MPYKRHETEVIEKAIREEEQKSKSTSDCPAENATIRRWVKQFKERGKAAVGWLGVILHRIAERYISPLWMKEKGLLEQLAYMAHSILSKPTDDRVIGTVNIILTRYHHGYL